MESIDKVIIGAGIYGLYSALVCGKKGQKIVVIECDSEAFSRATYVNQARVHMGYHYPRSLSTAIKSAGYFKRFNEQFEFCIHKQFRQIYATSDNFSWTDAKEFEKFCAYADIFCEKVDCNKYFKSEMCDGAFLTEEYTYDAMILKEYFIEELSKLNNVQIWYNSSIINVDKDNQSYYLEIARGEYSCAISTNFILNTTYASINQIHKQFKLQPFKIKYELCEIVLCDVTENLKEIGLTVMDGPFFSIMPFGKTGLHSLTAVSFTPHSTSYDEIPNFECQNSDDAICSNLVLGNCNSCKAKPRTAWNYMSNLARKYMKDDLKFTYKSSLFSMKPILMASEIDDSRPTMIKKYSGSPVFISVLSGKINTVYDLDEFLV